MLKVAITGNIASGKSVVQDFLKSQGYPVLDTDEVGHEVLRTAPEIKNAFFGYDIYNSDGSVSREKLGQLVFTDNSLKLKLESISHPLIKDRIVTFFNNQINSKFCFVGIPLLFEARMENLFDKIIFIASDENVRLNRLMLRNGYDFDYAMKRIKSQIPQEDKFSGCDYIIYNNGSIEELNGEILNVISVLNSDKTS